MSYLLRFGFFLARIYWSLTQPISVGAAALVFKNNQNEVLLVRHTYRSGWALPGGGVKRSETVLEAVKRELYEEVGLLCTSEPELISPPMFARTDGKHDHKLIFAIKDWHIDESAPESMEISERSFFSLDNLPVDLGAGTRRLLESIKDGQELTYHW